MKLGRNQVLRVTLRSALGLAMVGGLLTACGEDASNPEAVDITELKSPGNLSVLDMGNGTVRLSWTGANNEGDFSGYNIYGVKDDADIIAKAGDSIQLLTSEGEENSDGKALLQKMSYNGTDWESVGTVNPELDAEFQIVPYYENKTDEDTPIIPSCRPDSSGEACTMLTKTSMTTPDNYAFNGSTYVDLEGLKMDGEYCFAIASTLDDGSKISFTTSNVACVIPRAEIEADATAKATSKYYFMDFAALRESCDENGDCDIDTLGLETEKSGACIASTDNVACIENYNSTVNFTAGKWGAIQDLGHYPNGFSDSKLVEAAKISWDDEGLIHGGGYSLPGQSLVLEDNHVYVIAERDQDDTSKFYYHYVYVADAGTSSSTIEFSMTIRVAQIAGDL